VDVSTRPSRTPILAGAAANGVDPRSTNPFAAMTGARQAARTTPQPVLTDDMIPPGVNGAALDGDGPAGQRRGHRGRRARGGRGSGRRRWPIVTTSLAVLVVAIVVGGFLAYKWTQTQYYVAADKNGEVVIYQGVNESVAGLSLSHPHTYTGIKLSQVPSDYQQQLTAAITAGNLADAQKTVTNVSSQVGQCQTWYTNLKNWQTQDLSYKMALQEATKNKKPKASVKGNPGPMPTDKPAFQCPPPAAYGILSDELPPGTT
jgi:hypothetical protein